MTQTSPAKVKATELIQVGLVVKDVQKTAENYWNILGIGPWDIYELHAPVLSDVVYHGKPTQFSMKLGVAMVGKVQLGLFEPVSGNSIYSDFLAEYGEGLHHLQFAADNVAEITQIMVEDGFPVLMSGRIGDGAFAFYDTADALKAIWGAVQPSKGISPDYRYPESETQASPAKLKVKRISQVAIVIKDIPTVVKNYWNILGIGPWLIFPWESPHIYNRRYHEKPASTREKIAIAEMRNVQFEPVQPVAGDSIYFDFIEERGEGLHHLQFIVDEVDEVSDVDEAVEVLAKEGFPCLQRANIGDTGTFAYIDIKPLHVIWEPIHRAKNRGVEPIHYPVIE